MLLDESDGTNMDFDTKLANYADLIVRHGLNVQPGQVVNIGAEVIHRDLVVAIVEAAYACGAKLVDVDLTDARVFKTRLERAGEADLDFVPRYITERYKDIVETTGANLKIIGSEDPDVLSQLDPKRVNRARVAAHKAVRHFYDEGIAKSRVHWTVASAATPAWGKKVFPELSPEEAHLRLWDEIFRICRADQPNCVELWKEHNAELHARARHVTELGIRELHFTGPGTDLVVGLSPKAVFRGGSDRSPRGVDFEPNLPTEEVFTTPDYRATRGHVRATRPFLVSGKLVEELEMVFENGVLSSFRAKSGAEALEEYVNSDEGGRRLGEVALVGIDSPVYRSGRVFQEILLDENAACHIAVGQAYKFCLDGGESMTAEELTAIGCNESSVHTDMMISSEEVDVVAHTFDGRSVPLIRNGEWAI
ncbi:MAG: aminopeptidase [Planctomycetes bacterium]|nr:aminopeptidase [Planctomycetota bacterium]